MSAICIAGGEAAVPRKIEALLELTVNAALALCQREVDAKTIATWRRTAAEASARADESVKALDEILRHTRYVDDVARALADLPATSRYQRLGEAIARAASASDWLVARVREGRVDTLWASPGRLSVDFDPDSIAESCASSAVVVRDARTYLPFDNVAVVLAPKRPLTDEQRARLDALVSGLRDLVRVWCLETVSEERRSLLQRMGLRLFAAVDEERSRIARDLHDDQAQLLTAARIALEGGREEARTILTQIEAELRRRTRELRPALLGALTLDEKINRELERLAAAGVAGRFVHGPGAAQISRPIQQLCYQVRARLSLTLFATHMRIP